MMRHKNCSTLFADFKNGGRGPPAKEYQQPLEAEKGKNKQTKKD